MAGGLVGELLEAEKAVLNAVTELADAAGDTAKAALEGAAGAIRNVINTVAGDDAPAPGA